VLRTVSYSPNHHHQFWNRCYGSIGDQPMDVTGDVDKNWKC